MLFLKECNSVVKVAFPKLTFHPINDLYWEMVLQVMTVKHEEEGLSRSNFPDSKNLRINKQ